MTSLFSRLELKKHLTLERIVVGLAFIAATAVILATPLQMPDPDDWAYKFGAENFAAGHFTISNSQQLAQAKEAVANNGTLLQYLPLEFNRWALEKAPGAVFYLAPFEKLGIPRWGNVVLAFFMVLVTFLLLKRLRGERAAMLGSLLVLFTPIALVMFNRAYMDTYPSLALLAIGGGLYLYYHLERPRFGRFTGGLLLFLSFLGISWSVVTRYTNLPIAIILALHLGVVWAVALRKGEGRMIGWEIVPVILGIGLPLAGMLVYGYYVFGSALTYGYAISPYPIKFAFQYIGQTWDGQSIPGLILKYNAEGYARNLLIGFPLLVVGLPGFVVLLYQKVAAWWRHDENPEGTWSGLRAEVSWGLLLVLTGWFLSVYLPYLGYEWTAGLDKGGGFVLLNRFLLPGLFPIVIVAALTLDRLLAWVWLPVVALLAAFGLLLYFQWALDWRILPAWLTERTLATHWPGYVFPPWTPWFQPGAGPSGFPFPPWTYPYFFPMP